MEHPNVMGFVIPTGVPLNVEIAKPITPCVKGSKQNTPCETVFRILFETIIHPGGNLYNKIRHLRSLFSITKAHDNHKIFIFVIEIVICL